MISPTQNNKVRYLVEGFINANRIPHAIMIEGENHTESLDLALYIATAAVCDNPNAPCGKCNNCHLAQAGSHPDIARIKALDGKKFLSVSQIRELRTDAFVKAHQAARRVFIIEDAHRMNEQAQNALLKILEEPPKNVIFILPIPSKTMLLDTIISRCVLLSLIGNQTQDDNFIQLAHRFIDLLLSGNEYEMLKLLLPLEKNRADVESFFKALSICITLKIKANKSHAKMLDRLFDDTKYYLELLTTNINIALLMSVVTSRSKGLLDIC